MHADITHTFLKASLHAQCALHTLADQMTRLHQIEFGNVAGSQICAQKSKVHVTMGYFLVTEFLPRF